MSSRRTNISIPSSLYEAAQGQIPLHYCDNFSDYVAALIRRDVQEHQGGTMIQEVSAGYKRTGKSATSPIETTDKTTSLSEKARESARKQFQQAVHKPPA